MILPTVKIVRGDDYAIINESDFDPERHTLYGAAPGANTAAVPAREDIATMGKAEAREWLEELGVEVPSGAKVADLRAALSKALFVDL